MIVTSDLGQVVDPTLLQQVNDAINKVEAAVVEIDSAIETANNANAAAASADTKSSSALALANSMNNTLQEASVNASEANTKAAVAETAATNAVAAANTAQAKADSATDLANSAITHDTAQDGRLTVCEDSISKIAGADHNYILNLLSAIYPIGSIYLSVNATSPATLFGGTWTQIKDKFLLGSGNTYALGTTGGEATHVLTAAELPVHFHTVAITSTTESATHTHTGTAASTNTDHTHSGNTGTASANHTHGGTTDAQGMHTHPVTVKMADAQAGTNKDRACHPNSQTNTWDGAATASGNHAHNLSVAADGWNHYHGFTTGAMSANGAHTHSVTTGNNSATHTHNVSGNTGNIGSDTAHNNMPPYLVVTMWQRTA